MQTSRSAAISDVPYVNIKNSSFLETYYPRFGYVPAAQFGIKEPAGIPSANFMALKLRPEALQAKLFGVLKETA